MLPVKDALEVLHGRWKLPIIVSRTFGPERFNQIAKEIGGITGKILSRELKDLALNQLVTRKVVNTFPLTVEYNLTPHGMILHGVIRTPGGWGITHWKKIL